MKTKTTTLQPHEIDELNMNGMKGRMAYVKAKNPKDTQEILFIYGVHATIERFTGITRYLSRYGNITMPDLPGFGGMDTFYSVGLTPTIDNYADYLASFIKLRYKSKKITIIGMSFGFAVVTRMLQRNPDLHKRVQLLVSIVGIADKTDFSISKFTNLKLRSLFLIMSHDPTSWIMKTFILQRPIIGFFYKEHHPKMKGFTKNERRALVDYETYLWKCNELKTYANCMDELFTLRHPSIEVKVPLHHIGTPNDQWLNNERTMASLANIFPNITGHTAQMENHGASLFADEEDAGTMIPKSIQAVVARYRHM